MGSVVEVMGQLSNQNTLSQIARLHDLITETTDCSHTLAIPEKTALSQFKRRKQPVTTAQVEQMVRDYQAGMTLKAIGEKCGVNERTVSIHLEQRGTRRRYRVLDEPSRVERVVLLYSDGLSLEAVAREVGVSRGAVHDALVRAGVDIRGNHRLPE